MSDSEAALNSATSPSRARYLVVALGVLLAMITYLDRACIATLAPDIQKELSLTKDQMSYVFMRVFSRLCRVRIPTAAWADRIGIHVLARIVIWWSTFTIATAAAAGQASLMVIRFLFGAGRQAPWPSGLRGLQCSGSAAANEALCKAFSLPHRIVRRNDAVSGDVAAASRAWRTVFVLFG